MDSALLGFGSHNPNYDSKNWLHAICGKIAKYTLFDSLSKESQVGGGSDNCVNAW
jgi:hypothetical protein